MTATCLVRALRPEELPLLLGLCAEHAQYERTAFEPDGAVERWSDAVFAAQPRLRVWVAECATQLVGYASAAIEYSTWRAGEYLHMDCLFVRARRRGCGIGAELLRAVVAAARKQGLDEVQWQTPQWNVDAARFYARHGAVSMAKRRYTLPLR